MYFYFVCLFVCFKGRIKPLPDESNPYVARCILMHFSTCAHVKHILETLHISFEPFLKVCICISILFVCLFVSRVGSNLCLTNQIRMLHVAF